MSQRRFKTLSPIEKATLRKTNRRPLMERANMEGNIGEWPVFVLSPREARPTIPNKAGLKDDKGRVIREPDLPRYVRRSVFEYELPSGTVTRTIISEASHTWGFPTTIGLEVLLHVCLTAQGDGFRSPYVRFTYSGFAKATGRTIAGSVIETVRREVHALLKTSMTFENAWKEHPSTAEIEEFVKARREGLEAKRPESRFLRERVMHILAGASLPTRQEAAAPAAAQAISRGFETSAPAAGDQAGVLVVRGDEPPGLPAEGWVRLSDELLESLRRGYRFGVDPDYFFDLEGGITKRLYILLTKRDDARGFYEEDAIRFGRRIGLAKVGTAREVFAELTKPVANLTRDRKDGKRFLEGCTLLPSSNGGWKLHFEFAKVAEHSEKSLVVRLQEYLKSRLRPDIWSTWFECLSFRLLDVGAGKLLMLEAPDQFIRDFLHDNYEAFLRDEALPAVLDKGETAPRVAVVVATPAAGGTGTTEDAP